MKNPINKRSLLSLAGICMAGSAWAQDTTGSTGESLFSNYLFLGMLTLIVCLLLVIAVLGSVVTNLAEYKYINKASKMKTMVWVVIALCTLVSDGISSIRLYPGQLFASLRAGNFSRSRCRRHHHRRIEPGYLLHAAAGDLYRSIHHRGVPQYHPQDPEPAR